MNVLVSFADSRMLKSSKRLLNQAKKFNFFDKIFLLNENDLSKNFKNKFKKELILGSKGYGYWCWKPEIILNILDKLNNDDSLLYIDIGCHLNINGKNRLLEYFEIVKQQDKGILAFQACKPNKKNSKIDYDGRKLMNSKNYQWIKGDVFDFFEARYDTNLTNSEGIGGGIFLIKKSEKSIKIIKKWREIILNNFNFINDTPSISPNLEGFIENRHDQAIWTLLCLKEKIKIVSAYEYWYPKKNSTRLEPDWQALEKFPIHAKRDKDLGFYGNSKLIFKKKLYKLFNALSKINIGKKPVKKNFYS